jgi:hypothetical protein
MLSCQPRWFFVFIYLRVIFVTFLIKKINIIILKCRLFISLIARLLFVQSDVFCALCICSGDHFCSQHDVVCCRACLSESHRSCGSVLPLDSASKDVKNSSLLSDTLEEKNLNISNKKNQYYNLEMSTFYISNSSTAIRPIRCSKGLPMRRLSFRNESEGGGSFGVNTRGESLQK